MPKKKHTAKSIEDIYCNKLFVPPKEQNLETIFEEPRQSKDGAPVLTSIKKYKRYLHFDPSQNKIQKRKQKAKKCLKKLKLNYRVTRSSPESSKSDDISLYMSDILGDSSSDSDMDTSFTNKLPPNDIDAELTPNVSENSVKSEGDMCETPKRKDYERRSSNLFQRDKDLIIATGETGRNCDTEESGVTLRNDTEKSDSENAAETGESRRFPSEVNGNGDYLEEAYFSNLIKT